MFAWIKSEIIRIELIVVSLSDNLCAQRGEVPQRETPPWSELSMPICTDAVKRLRLTSPLVCRMRRRKSARLHPWGRELAGISGACM